MKIMIQNMMIKKMRVVMGVMMVIKVRKSINLRNLCSILIGIQKFHQSQNDMDLVKRMLTKIFWKEVPSDQFLVDLFRRCER